MTERHAAARAREVVGECLTVPYAALERGEIVADCLTRLESESVALCETCSLTEEITAALVAAGKAGRAECIEHAIGGAPEFGSVVGDQLADSLTEIARGAPATPALILGLGGWHSAGEVRLEPSAVLGPPIPTPTGRRGQLHWPTWGTSD